MKVYHIAYEPNFKSVDIHFWTKCNLSCKACYTNYETLDFGLLDDPITAIAGKPPGNAPESFLSLTDTMARLRHLEIKYAIFMGTEAALDPKLSSLAKALHDEFRCRNLILTNGLKLPDLNDVDEVIFSIKAVTNTLHEAYTGKHNHKILDNFRALRNIGKKVQAETVLIPDMIDAEEIERIAKFIGEVDKDVPLRIDAYFPVGCNPWRAATAGEVEYAAKRARKHLNKVSCLTLEMNRIGDRAVRIF